MNPTHELHSSLVNAKSTQLSILSTISSADIVSKSVLLVLLIASIWTWAMVFYKYAYLSSVERKIVKFEKLFWSRRLIEQLYDKIHRNVDNPLAAIFVSAIDEFKIDRKKYQSDTLLSISLKDRILQVMHLNKSRESIQLEKGLVSLAIIGSSAPFIGLLGTVWGIMNSFQSVAATKNTNLAVVAPGIAEALFATAIGLFATIPAVIFYNLFINKVNKIDNKIDNFICEMHNMLSKTIDEER